MVYFAACLIAGYGWPGKAHVNHRAHEIYNRVFRKVPEKMMEK